MNGIERTRRSTPVLIKETAATPDAVPELRRATVAYARAHGLPQSMFGDIRLAVSEATANTVMHAYEPQDEHRSIRLRAEIDGGFLTVTLTDDGHGIRAKPSEGQGLGLGLIASSTADFAIERREPRGTLVRMRFVIPTR